MTGMPEHAHRAAEHRQPRDRRTIDPATGVNAGPPSDRDGADDAPDEAKGPSTPAPVAVPLACNYGAHDFVFAPDSPFGDFARHNASHVHICAACEATYIDPGAGPCHACRHPLTPADPHLHAWADLGTPGLHGSVCRLCGETQID